MKSNGISSSEATIALVILSLFVGLLAMYVEWWWLIHWYVEWWGLIH